MTDRSNITLYSGGHKGAEAEFGRLADRWGIQEVNFSFEGHDIERSRGVRVLSPEELEKGNVSMEIVSTRMGRNYSRSEKIRKVIQSRRLHHFFNQKHISFFNFQEKIENKLAFCLKNVISNLINKDPSLIGGPVSF